MEKINKRLFSVSTIALMLLGATGSVYAQAPANDDCSGAVALTPSTTQTCSVPASGSGLDATMSLSENDCSYLPTNDLWYSFVAANATQVIELTNVSPTTGNLYYYGYTMAIYSGGCGALTEMDCNDGYEDIEYGDPATDIIITKTGLTVGATYYIQVAGDFAYDVNYDDAVTGINFNICVHMPPPPPPNDECAGASFINSSGTTTLSNIGATSSMPPVTCETYTANEALDIWFKFVPATTGNITVDVDQTDIDAVWELFGGTCGNLTSLACADEAGPLSAAVTAGQTYYLRAYEYGSNDGDFIITVGGVPLPVQFVTLSGEVKNNHALLSWITSSESNNKGFTIQRSADGKNFRPVGFLSSLAPNGNSEQRLRYSFEDPEQVSGIVYYRLEQMDIDGKKKLSKILRLAGGDASFDLVVSPNPFTQVFSVNTYGAQSNNGVISIMSMSGRTVRTITVSGNETLVDLSAEPAGIYIVKYSDNENNKTVKVNKL